MAGGKFANGARTSAFAHLFNQEGRSFSGIFEEVRGQVRAWWETRTTVPEGGAAAAAGVGWDVVLSDFGKTGGIGVVKFDFNDDLVTDSWGVHYYDSQNVFGVDVGLQVEAIFAPNNGFQGYSYEAGGSAYGFDMSASDPTNVQNPNLDTRTYTLGAGPGLGGHTATNRTRVFMLTTPD